MTKEQADSLVASWSQPQTTNAMPATAASAPVQPTDQSEPWMHYIQRSPAYPYAQDMAARASDDLSTGASAVGQAAGIAGNVLSFPMRAAGYVARKALAPVMNDVSAGAQVLGQAAMAPYRAGFGWFKRNILPAETATRVRVQSPDGKIGTIPGWQVDDAKAKGYTVVE